MVAYNRRMPAGIPGDINRIWGSNVEAQVITPNGTTGAPTAYGVPVCVDNTGGNVGNMRTLTASDSATPVYGLLARPFPTTGGAPNTSYGFGSGTPPYSGVCDVLVSGYMAVLASGPTAITKGAQAYVWVGSTSSSHTAGGFEAAVVTGSTIIIPNCKFMGPPDANNITEVSFNI